MSPEAQRIAIAEACGWTKCRLAIKGAGAPERGKSPYGVPPRRGYEVSLPNYTQDLNAMHEAEKVLVNDQRINFIDNLLDVLGLNLGPGGWDMDFDSVWQITHATVPQRAEAFLRTIGKWEEEAKP